MVYRHKPIAVTVLRLPNNNLRVVDIYGKIDELTPKDFAKYYTTKLTHVETDDTKLRMQIKDKIEDLIFYTQSVDLDKDWAELESMIESLGKK